MFIALILESACFIAPEPWGPLPTEPQAQFQEEELAAFIHYGMNTYTEREWGKGDEDPNIFNPTALDTDQWVRSLKNAGFKRIIYTAKHHDGFCTFNSQFTSHQVNESKEFQETSRKLGQSGDVLEELSKSCTKYDMKLGLYLSPWDENSPHYGKGDEYNIYYMNQIREVLGNKKYGNNGKFAEFWMDGAKESGAPDQPYWFLEWFKLILELQPDSIIESPYGSTSRWVGNENGEAGETCWSRISIEYQRSYYDSTGGGDDWGYLNHGDENGDIYSVAECDVSIVSGWFWLKGRIPKSMDELTDIYFKAVGRGQPLLMNVPPNKEGKIPDEYVNRLNELYQTINESFKNNFAYNPTSKITATSSNGNNFMLINEPWSPNDGSFEVKIIVDLGHPVTFDVVSIQEVIRLGQRIKEVIVEVHIGDEWREFGRATTVGHKRLIRNTAVTADKVVFKITSAQANPVIKCVGVFKAFGAFAMGDGYPSGLDYKDHTVLEVQGSWTEDGDGSNKWTTEVEASLRLKFTGTKAWVTGTKDPNHGIMNVYIDDALVASPNTHADSRKLNTVLYVTDDLSNSEHTLKVECGSVAIGIHGIYLLSNDGVGMFELESLTYDVAKGKSVTLTINRVGGSSGSARMTFQTAPNTAVHGRHYVDVFEELTFKAGETSKQVSIQTIDHHEPVGNLTFYGQIVEPKDKSITGFNVSSTITIISPNMMNVGSIPISQSENKNDTIFYVVSIVGTLAVAIFALIVIKAKRSEYKEKMNEEPLLTTQTQ